MLFIIALYPNVPVGTLRRFYKKSRRKSVKWEKTFNFLVLKPFSTIYFLSQTTLSKVSWWHCIAHTYRQYFYLVSVIQNSSFNVQMYELANVISFNKGTHFKWCVCCCLRTDINFYTFVHVLKRNVILTVFKTFSSLHMVWLIIVCFPRCLSEYLEKIFHETIRDDHGYF